MVLAINALGLCSSLTTTNGPLAFIFDKGDCDIVIYAGGETDAIKVGIIIGSILSCFLSIGFLKKLYLLVAM